MSKVNKQQNSRPASAKPEGRPAAPGGQAPWSVKLATAIVAVQSLAVMAFGVFLAIRDLTGAENESMVTETATAGHVGIGTAAFIFIVFGFVLAAAWAYLKGRRWGRGALHLIELIFACSAFQMLAGGAIALGVLTFASALGVISLMLFMPESVRWAEANF